MYTFKLNGSDDLELDENENGLITFKVISGAEATIQLVKQRLLIVGKGRTYEPDGAIPWFTIMDNPKLSSILGTLVTILIASTDGVEEVDLSKTEFTLNPPTLKYVKVLTDEGFVETSI